MEKSTPLFFILPMLTIACPVSEATPMVPGWGGAKSRLSVERE